MTINLSLFLAALAAVESGNNPSAIGGHGERSQFQMVEAVWRQHAAPGEPFELATTNPAKAEEIAEKHVIWLTRELERHHTAVTVENLAITWHGGLGAALVTGHTPAQGDYANRIAAIYAESVAKLPRDVPAQISA